MRKCLHSVCLAVCLSVSSDSWLSSHDNVHIYSLGEGKTIVPGDFPNSISGPDKDPADSDLWTHSERAAVWFLWKRPGGRRGNSGLEWLAVSRFPAFAAADNGFTSHWLAQVHVARVQTSGTLQLSVTNHFPPPSTETESAGATYGEKSPQQGGNSLEKRRSRRFCKKSKQTFILCRLVKNVTHVTGSEKTLFLRFVSVGHRWCKISNMLLNT